MTCDRCGLPTEKAGELCTDCLLVNALGPLLTETDLAEVK